MLYFALFSALILLPPILGFGIIISEGPRAKNSIAGVTMPPPARYEKDRNSYRAVCAQEVSEYWLRWAVSFLVTLPFLVFVTDHWMAVLLVPFIASLWSAPFYAQLDLVGKSIEVLVAGQDGYLEAEAAQLIGSSNGNFTGQSIEAVAHKITARNWIARPLIFLLRRNWEGHPV